jgi:hypothetical protein
MNKVFKYTRLALLTLALLLSTTACEEPEPTPETQQPTYNTRPCTTSRPCKAGEDEDRSFGTAND